LAPEFSHLRMKMLLHHELLELCCHSCLLHFELLMQGQLTCDCR